METNDLKRFIKDLPQFTNIEEKAINWLIDKSEIRTFKKKDFVFKQDDPLEHLLIILSGSVDVYFDSKEGHRDFSILKPRDITGNLPFSRAKVTTAFGRALEETSILYLHKSYFTEMVSISYELTQSLVAIMSDRIRDVSQIQFQDEKLKALGKISAGLAHEINNPVSAIVRSSEILHRKLKTAPDSFKDAIQISFDPDQAEAINKKLFKKIDQFNTAPVDLSLLDRQDRTDELLDWFEDCEQPNAEELAETFTDFNFTEEDLDDIKDILDDEQKIKASFIWMDHQLNVEMLVKEIKEASSRVSTLIKSVKEYSHMDQGSGKQEVDLHNGLRTTLSIFGHQFKEKQIEVDKQFFENLPTINANAGELNQVWTNLMSNAIDAVEPGGRISISTFMDRDYICVCIEDNGSGIPDEMINKIWEPFFTTKKVGDGTGIGLDIVKKIIERHRGEIKVESKPGKTRFITQFYNQ